jgi:sugar lactone lactonase YvrE
MFQSLLNMGLRKDSNGRPEIAQVSPVAAIAGGEFQIRGKGFTKPEWPRVTIGDVVAPLTVGSDSFVIAKVPEGASTGELVISSGPRVSQIWACDIGIPIADSLHPVSNPAVDSFGNIYSTFSGSRGQKVPVAVYKIDLNYSVKPFINDMMNPSGMAFDWDGMLYITSRFDGVVYQATPNGNISIWVEGMGVATGIAFDDQRNMYVGDRSGTIFKISPERQIFVFATIEPSIAAYHLACGPDGYLYVSGPTTSSFDSIYRVSRSGEVEVFYRGLGRPQGMAFDAENRLYIAASLGGRRGVVRISEDRKAELFLSGPGIVGLAFTPSRALAVTTTNAVYRVDVGIKGRPLY